MDYSTAIGIDLGTTHTVAAIYQHGKPVIIPNLQGNRLTPSVVFYNPINLQVTVGSTAEDQSLKCPENFLFDMKRMIGRNYYDAYVQHFVQLQKTKQCPLHIIRAIKNGQNQLVVKLQTLDESLEITKSPEQASSDILKFIKESAKESLGTDVKDAVISVPAYFSYAQRAATRRAAELAGFTVLKLITEPVAAAIHYTYEKSRKDDLLFMFDFGGGTLDVSIISISKSEFTVKTIEGDVFLGGSDFDEIVFNYLRVEVERRFGMKNLNRDTKRGQRFIHRLRRYAKRFKEMLTSLCEYSISIETDMDEECDISLTREVFERLSEDLLKRVEDKVNQCLQSANISVKDITKVVLVGGSSRLPMVRQMLSAIFSHIELSTDIHADEAVALGAAIHAALLKNEVDAALQYKVNEVAPFSIGIEAKYSLMIDFIKKGATLPALSSQIMQTTDNDQLKIDFEVYEGERKNCKLNNRLGMFSINNIPCGRSGEVAFQVTFELDEDGVLEVRAVEQKTETANQITIQMDQLTLCAAAMFVSLAEEIRMKEEDQIYDKFQRLRLQAETFCKTVMYTLDNAIVRHGLLIEKECREFLKSISALDYTEIEALEKHFGSLKNRTLLALPESGNYH